MLKEYIKWAKLEGGGIDDGQVQTIINLASRFKQGIDGICQMALDQGIPPSQLIGDMQARLAKAESFRLQTKSAQPPQEEAEGEIDPDSSAEEKEAIRERLARIPWKPIIIGVSVVLILAAIGAGWYFLSRQAPVRPEPTTIAVVNNLSDGLFGKDAFRFAMRSAPESVQDIVKNWLGWLILIPLGWLLMQNFKSETTDRNEPKDYRAIARGLIVCAVLFFLADAIALKTIQACQFLELGCTANDVQYWTTIILRAVGASFLIGSGFAAAAGGNWDASPVSVAFFLVGILIKMTWPGAEFLGNVALVTGIVIHFYEIIRHEDERASALAAGLFTVIASLAVGTLALFGANAIAFLVPYRLAIAFIALVFAGLGASGTIQHKVGGVFRGTLRENLQDVSDTIYFDLKILVLMAAISYVIIG